MARRGTTRVVRENNTQELDFFTCAPPLGDYSMGPSIRLEGESITESESDVGQRIGLSRGFSLPELRSSLVG